MTIPAKAFQRWLQGIAPDVSTADVCRISGIKRTTLAQQLVRGKVSVSTVVSISRAYNVNPLAALATFEAYRDLAGPQARQRVANLSARFPRPTSCGLSLRVR